MNTLSGSELLETRVFVFSSERGTKHRGLGQLNDNVKGLKHSSAIYSVVSKNVC